MLDNFRILYFLLSLSFLATLSIQIYPELIIPFGMNNYYFENGQYFHTFIQFFSSQFIHGDFFHLLFNAIFILIFGKIVEEIIGRKYLTIFFICSSIFIGISLLIFSTGITVGMSGFAMGLLAFYTMKLYEMKNPEYKGGLFALFLNVAIGFSPEISLVGHLFGGIFGMIYYFLLKIFK